MNDPERLLWRHLEDRHTLEVLLLHQLLLITLVTPRVSVSRVIGSLVGIKTKASSQPISTKKTDLCCFPSRGLLGAWWSGELELNRKIKT